MTTAFYLYTFFSEGFMTGLGDSYGFAELPESVDHTAHVACAVIEESDHELPDWWEKGRDPSTTARPIPCGLV